MLSPRVSILEQAIRPVNWVVLRHWLVPLTRTLTYTISPALFLIDLRMKYACDLLVNSQKKIYEIASDTGFCDAMYFSHIFTQHIGCTPNEYRKQNLSQSW